MATYLPGCVNYQTIYSFNYFPVPAPSFSSVQSLSPFEIIQPWAGILHLSQNGEAPAAREPTVDEEEARQVNREAGLRRSAQEEEELKLLFQMLPLQPRY